MKGIELLSASEKDLLLKFPAYITLLALNNDRELPEKELEDAVHFSHIKTFTAHPQLRDFFRKADEVFRINLWALNARLPVGRAERELAIKEELSGLEQILLKLDKNYAALLHKSMSGFKAHVSRAHRNVLEDFVFPLPIKGIND